MTIDGPEPPPEPVLPRYGERSLAEVLPALMHALGLKAYRFSVSWSRVLPQGRGVVNRAGLDFYDRLVDALLEHGIAPLVTLYHWDLPAALDDRGGWLNPDIAHWFADYAALLFRRLDDRVRLWATLNEPWVVVDGGYLHGALAPGHRNKYEAPIATHNLLRAHGAAVQCCELGDRPYANVLPCPDGAGQDLHDIQVPLVELHPVRNRRGRGWWP